MKQFAHVTLFSTQIIQCEKLFHTSITKRKNNFISIVTFFKYVTTCSGNTVALLIKYV